MAVFVGSPVRVSVTFRALVNNVSTVVDPVSVVVNILDSTGAILFSDTPVKDGFGIYHYDWTPSATGPYTMQFVGTFSDSTTDTVSSNFVAETYTSQPFDVSSNTLEQDQYLTFMVDPTPFYIDPEAVQSVFPEASLIQISELIYDASQEALDFFTDTGAPGPQTQVITPNIQTTIEDFVMATVCCNLMRIYAIGGMNDITEVSLGDLTVNTRNNIKEHGINRASASTWCELAGVIRDELYALSNRSGMKAILKGSKYHNPMPKRQIRTQEWRRHGWERGPAWRQDWN